MDSRRTLDGARPSNPALWPAIADKLERAIDARVPYPRELTINEETTRECIAALRMGCEATHCAVCGSSSLSLRLTRAMNALRRLRGEAEIMRRQLAGNVGKPAPRTGSVGEAFREADALLGAKR